MIRCTMSKLFKAICVLSSITFAENNPESITSKEIIRTQLTEADLLYEFTMPVKIIAENHAKTQIQYYGIYYSLLLSAYLIPLGVTLYIKKQQDHHADNNKFFIINAVACASAFGLRNIFKNEYSRYVGNLFTVLALFMIPLSIFKYNVFTVFFRR